MATESTECSKKLREFSEKQGLGPKALARLLERPYGTVWNWLHSRTNPDFDTQLEVYQKLGLIDGAPAVDLPALLSSMLKSTRPILQYFLTATAKERAGLRQNHADMLFNFQLYFRALASEDARKKILDQFPQLFDATEEG